ncbi:MAG: hypothetical protein V7767_15715 [Leeuwenhoekiella sp.]
MELNKIEQLLDAYFEGETTLAEEQKLRDYFTGDDVATHLEPYIAMFSAFAKAKQEVFTGEINLPQTQKKRSLYWIPIAASIAIIIGLFLTFNTGGGQHDYGTYKDPDVAALKTKQALYMMSSFMDEGAEQLEALDEFKKTTDKYLK